MFLKLLFSAFAPGLAFGFSEDAPPAGGADTPGEGGERGQDAPRDERTLTEAEANQRTERAVRERLERERKRLKESHDAELAAANGRLAELEAEIARRDRGEVKDEKTFTQKLEEQAQQHAQRESELKRRFEEERAERHRLASERIIESTMRTQLQELGCDPRDLDDAVRLARYDVRAGVKVVVTDELELEVRTLGDEVAISQETGERLTLDKHLDQFLKSRPKFMLAETQPGSGITGRGKGAREAVAPEEVRRMAEHLGVSPDSPEFKVAFEAWRQAEKQRRST